MSCVSCHIIYHLKSCKVIQPEMRKKYKCEGKRVNVRGQRGVNVGEIILVLE